MLFEFTGILSVSIVVAAKSESEATEAISVLSTEGWARMGDKKEVLEYQLEETRPSKSDDPSDEAHIVIL